MQRLTLADLKTNKEYLFYRSWTKEWLIGTYVRSSKTFIVNEEYVVEVGEETLIYSLPPLPCLKKPSCV